MKQSHIIGRKTFNLGFYSRTDAVQMQNTISRINKERLTGILESFLNRYSIEDKLIYIDSLQLNVGDIPYDQLEEELPARFEKELERLLPSFIRESVNNPGEKNYTSTSAENLMGIFRIYLNRGTIPWRSSLSGSGFIQKMLEQLVASQPAEFAAMIRSEAKQTNVLRRIVYQFTDQQLEILVRVLEPAEAAFIIAYSNELDATVKKKPVAGITYNQKFRNIKWELIIGYLVSDRGSDFNRIAFLRYMIAGLAARYNLSYEALLKQFVLVVQTLPVPVGAGSSLPALLQRLEIESEEEFDFSQAEKKKTKTETEFITENEFQLLRYVLLHGSMPYQAGKTRQTEFRLLVQKLLTAHPAETISTLAKLSYYPDTVSNYVLLTGNPQVVETVKIAEPAQAGNIHSFVKSLVSVSRKNQNVFSPEKEFTRAVWTFTLMFLLQNHGTQFSSRAFVRTSLKRIAARYATSYKNVLAMMLTTVDDEKSGIVWSPSLASVIHTLSKEDDPGSAAENNSTDSSQAKKKEAYPDNRMLADLIYEYFTSGKIPWWAKERYSSSDIKQVLDTLIRLRDQHLLRIVEKIADDDVAFERLIRQLDKKQISQLSALSFRSRNSDAFSEWIVSLEKNLLKKTGRRAQTRLFIHRLRVRMLQRMPSSGESVFSFSVFIFELIGEIKIKYNYSVSEILLLLADSVAELPAAHRSQMIAVLQKMHREKAELFYSEMAREEKAGTDRRLLEIWMAGEKLQNSKSQRQTHHAAAEAWIRMVLEHERPLIAGIADLSWQDMLDALRAVYPDDFEKQVPLLRKRYEQYSKSISVLTNLLPGADSVFTIFFSKGQNGFLKNESRKMLDTWISKILETHPVLTKELFGQWLNAQHIRSLLADSISKETLAALLAAFADKSSGLSGPLLLDFFSLWEKLKKDMPEIAKKKILEEAGLLFAAKMQTTPVSSAEWILSILRITGKLSGMDAHLISASWKQFAMKYASEWKSDLLLLLDHLSDPVYLDRIGDRFLARLKKMDEEIKKAEEARKRKEKEQQAEDLRERIIVPNAGLILAGPFINRLFMKLNLVSENKFVSEENRQRAVAVLQYIVQPESELAEHELTLNKILCGFEPGEPVDRSVVPDENEKAVCEDLIASLISNWKVLGSTSVETFRESFLQRKGGLIFLNNRWEMKVENKAYDKLLMKLPWSINMIRLPWMQYPIITEWKS